MSRIDGRRPEQLRPVEVILMSTALRRAPASSAAAIPMCSAPPVWRSVAAPRPRGDRLGDGGVLHASPGQPGALPRDISKLKLSPRSAEIQRLIGRSLRAAVDLEALGERSITVDCDVLQGDGGTRTASVTGGFVALALACRKLVDEGVRTRDPIRGQVAAVSAGIVEDQALLDLCYEEDSSAQVDLEWRHGWRGAHHRAPGHRRGPALHH